MVVTWWWIPVLWAAPEVVSVDGGAFVPPLPIVGGVPAPVGRYPDVVAILLDGRLACTGTLVAPDLVLTAGHCGQQGPTHVAVDVVEVEAADRVEVAEAWVYPAPLASYDIALLRLVAPVAVAPRILARGCSLGWLVDGATVTIAGFGSTDSGGAPGNTRLHEVDTSIVAADCEDPIAGCLAAVMPDGEIIAGGDGADSCVGDSGGPLFLHTPDGLQLAGVTSRGIYPATVLCGGGGIYVRADAVAGWIEDTAGVSLPAPACEGGNQPPDPALAGWSVVPGALSRVQLSPGDPDVGDLHTWEIGVAPQHGWASISPGGELAYLAPPTTSGVDTLVVRVRDDGEPPLSAEVSIGVVLTHEGGSGCSSGGGGCNTGGGGGGWLILPWLWRRRCSRS